MSRTILWIAAFLVAVAFGFGTRYFLAPQPPAPEEMKVLVKPQPQEPQPPGDVTLKLPPIESLPKADMSALDPSFQAIKGHFGHLSKSLLEEEPLPKFPSEGKDPASVDPNHFPPLSLPKEIRNPKAKQTPGDPKVGSPRIDVPEVPLIRVKGEAKIDPSPLEIPPLEIPCPPALKSPPRMAEAKPVLGYLPTRQASFDLQVNQVGTSGIRSAELWTIDSHGKAHLLDRTQEVNKPFRTFLPGEGIHDVVLVLVSGSGRRSEWKPEDSIRVVVDTTPPEVKLLGIRPDPAKPGNALVEWVVKDDHLDPESLVLEYSADRKTWQPVTTEPIPHTGKYSWDPKNLLNHEVQLRLRVLDRAGNEAEAYLPEQVSVDVVPPKGKLTGMRKVDGGVRPARMEILPIPRIANEEQKLP